MTKQEMEWAAATLRPYKLIVEAAGIPVSPKADFFTYFLLAGHIEHDPVVQERMMTHDVVAALKKFTREEKRALAERLRPKWKNGEFK